MIELLCTLGPASFDSQIIRALDKIGTSLFRINLSYTEIEDLEDLIAHIRAHSNVPICLDSEGSPNRQLHPASLTEKDKGAFALGSLLGIKHFAISFAHYAEDAAQAQEYIDYSPILKIECKTAINNLIDLAKVSSGLLIDRGDLSYTITPEHLPQVQKEIIAAGHKTGKKVYVATNLLESMIDSSLPTAAEVNDIHHTIMDGAAGLVLAGETAIGKYPVECATMVMRIAQEVSKAYMYPHINLTRTRY